MRYQEDRQKVLKRLAVNPRADLQGEYLSTALAAVQAIEDLGTRATTLAILAFCTPIDNRQTFITEAVTLSHSITDQHQQAETLIVIAKGLPPETNHELIAEALSAARQIEEPLHRTALLLELQDHLSEQDRNEVLPILIERPVYQLFFGSTLAEFILHWQQLGFVGLEDPGDQSAIWQQLATNSRHDFLEKLADLAPLIEHLGGQVLVQETIHTILEVVKQWP